ncbi:CbtA family protein [Massilia antarctica]|uniref:CbtA family protein n=1 Tax=Massilia antarctica TaxID=2765360 RepID=A0AA49A6V6_9BURK|nr:CbtA family protein [Massilia antarctica]QPI47900.1 CbtA family protein [Massilia antarctica]
MPLIRTAPAAGLGTFNRIIASAAAAGILAGLLLTGVQQLRVAPIILQAEVFESAAPKALEVAAPHSHADAAPHEHGHDAKPHEHAEEGAHEHGGWQPDDGMERTFYTAVANISAGIGFALLLAAAIGLHGGASGWRAGLLWGAAGYTVFFLAPSVGLPPELPGTVAAPLLARQMWWTATVMASAGGLALMVFAKSWPLRIAGALLLFVPHLVGSPQPAMHSSSAPPELARSFLYATLLANAAFWLAMGALAGYFYKKFG